MAIINVTLLIQAFHFFIAYIMIKNILFKPALLHIQAEDALQESLILTIQERQLLIAHKEQALAAHWQRVREYFAQNAPELKEVHLASFEKIPQVTLSEFEKSSMHEYAQKVSDQLVKKVDHVT